jgi:hypothetical protein
MATAAATPRKTGDNTMSPAAALAQSNIRFPYRG